MNIALYAATGHAGHSILTELLSRGHHVTAIVRDPAKLNPQPNLTIQQGTVDSAADIARILAATPYDAIVSAYGPPATREGVRELIPVTQNFIDAIGQTKSKRFLFVGGAGSLFVAPGITLIASGYLPEAYKDIAIAHADALELIRKSDIDWTCYSPAGFIEPGPRTGKFRVAKDDLIVDGQGNSKISFDDAAIAIVDELETPHYHRARFTAAY
jgi:putative NADH-flavin reductase